ncbi:tetratricopeptide repeat protein [bacterium]|nr:tetratricopeptide repeat protein [bacterium]
MGKKKRRRAQKSNRSLSNKAESPETMMKLSKTEGDILKWSFLALIVFLIYSNSLGGPFIFDDGHNILENSYLRLTNLSFKDIMRAGFDGPSSQRPVANISFALNYYFNSYNVLGYRLVNILIHITTGILLYLFASTTLSILSLRTGKAFHKWIPFFTALIWLVHPLQTQSVSYIVQRMNSLAAMFYVLSLLLYGRARLAEEKRTKWVMYAGCIMSGLLSLGSKEIAATLPFFIFLYEWYFFQDLSRAWLKRHLLPIAGILILFVVASFLYLGGNPLEKILLDYENRNFTMVQRIITEFRVVVLYISLLMLPHPSRLNLDYDFPISHSLTDPLTTLLSFVMIAGLIGLAFYMAKRERLLSFAILWFFGNLVIESSVIDLDLVFEHRTSLPSTLVILMAVTMAYRYIKPKWLYFGVLCAVAILLSFWTYERNGVWRDDISIWADCAKKSPNKARPHSNLGVAFLQQGRTEEAVKQFLETLRINPNYIDAHNNLGVIRRRQGRPEEAMKHFSEVLRIDPDYREAHNNLANTLSDLGRPEEAVKHYSEALRIDPNDAIAHYNLGSMLGRQGKIKEAMNHFSAAIKIKPNFPEARQYLQRTLQLMGKSPGASNANE